MLFSVFEHPNKQETNNTDGLLSFEEQLINSVGFGIYQEKVIIGSVRVSFLGYPSEMSVFKDGEKGRGGTRAVVYKSNENDWLLFSLSSRDVYHNLFFSFLGKHFLLFSSPHTPLINFILFFFKAQRNGLFMQNIKKIFDALTETDFFF